MELFREDTCFAMRTSHPLAKRQSVTVDDLKNETILMNNHPSNSMNELIRHLYQSGLPKSCFRFFDQLDVALAMAAAGQGITSLPVSFRQRDVDLAYVLYNAPACYMSYSLAWNSATKNPAVKLFCGEASRAVWPYPV